MMAHGLGDIESFPFIDPPKPDAIRAGRLLLRELGAIDEAGSLTGVGRRLARLPIDPSVGRMILEAERENALREVTVIAAGLSVQDPRERPYDKQQQADERHQQFLDTEIVDSAAKEHRGLAAD